MSIAEDVETLGRATPGVYWGHDEDGDPEPYLDGTVGDVLIWLEADGRYSVHVWGPPPMLERRLTAPELGLLLRCVASGLAVDLPCPTCEGSKELRRTEAAGTDLGALVYAPGIVRWRLADGCHPSGHRTWERPCPTCSEPGPEVECGACKGSGRIERRTCPRYGCKGTGKVPGPGVPTGRETVELAGAWMRGRPVEVLGYGRGADIDEAKADALWEIEALGADPSKALEKDRPFRDGDMLAVTYAAPGPGDPSTRGALGVLADELQRRGAERVPCDPGDIYAPCCNPDCGGHWGAGCPHCHWQAEHRKCLGRLVDKGGALGELLALDLVGAACPNCGPDGGWRTPLPSSDCRVCEGHGTALAQRLRQLGTASHPAASLTTAASA